MVKPSKPWPRSSSMFPGPGDCGHPQGCVKILGARCPYCPASYSCQTCIDNHIHNLHVDECKCVFCDSLPGRLLRKKIKADTEKLENDVRENITKNIMETIRKGKEIKFRKNKVKENETGTTTLEELIDE